MQSRYLLIASIAAIAAAMATPTFADQARGVVKKIDLPGEMFVIETDDDGENGLTFVVGDDVDFAEFMDDIEVGDEVEIEFDPDFCNDNPDCDGLATEIEES